jgi:hypothetical protein
MRKRSRLFVPAGALVAGAAGWFWLTSAPTQAAPSAADGAAEAVESDMHEFMEYVFQPTYQRLKKTMAEAPSDNAGWKGMKADSLILAEGGNLLLLRKSKENTDDWTQHSIAVRDVGGKLYRAAQSKDYAAARQHYETMITNCNACHQQFAHGEHILKP